MKKMLADKINRALAALAADSGLEWPAAAKFMVEEPREAGHGHLAANAALVLAKTFRTNPRQLAEGIISRLDNSEGWLEKAEAAGPGFINFTLSIKWWAGALADLLAAGDDYGRGTPQGRRVLVEFVSSNPTGPLHVGHGRGAAIGDALARLLDRAGYQVTREYYINDAGRQMRLLGESVLARMRELAGGVEPFPEDHYRGEYIRELAREALTEKGSAALSRPETELTAELTDFATRSILAGIKDDLDRFRVRFGADEWFSEKSLYAEGQVEKALAVLKHKGFVYEQDGALWFKATAFGDDLDRVLIKSGGDKTYFAADLAYHWHKLQRGFDQLINIWGSDHHGYVPRLKAAVAALGHEPEALSVLLVQFVSLVRDGRPVAMSTRAGEFVTLREVLDEVGPDAARFMFLTRSPDTTLDFDLNLARAQTRDNPVYYVQYAGARIESILRRAGDRTDRAADLTLLIQPEETDLIKHLAAFPELVETAARKREPHHLTAYLTALARQFHYYYGRHQVRTENDDLTEARLALCRAVRLVVRLGLDLVGVSSPDTM
ncbi:MAG: arginine--tRNA ligase [Candidatus Adiutrix sp.]|jgi:arginyl-tRNA synthetase|nr:arginine--tRNA ligase [Candidatus Adiutrix sp.]